MPQQVVLHRVLTVSALMTRDASALGAEHYLDYSDLRPFAWQENSGARSVIRWSVLDGRCPISLPMENVERYLMHPLIRPVGEENVR